MLLLLDLWEKISVTLKRKMQARIAVVSVTLVLSEILNICFPEMVCFLNWRFVA